jgi:prefoldin subunit 5
MSDNWCPENDGAYQMEMAEKARREKADRIEALEEKIENAAQAMSETADNWEARCYAIMAALGMDFGGYSEDVPDVGSYYEVNIRRCNARIEALEKRVAELEEALRNLADQYDNPHLDVREFASAALNGVGHVPEPKPAKCNAVQKSDSMVCQRCCITWDMNDPDPPECKGFLVVAPEASAALKGEN